MKVFNLALLLRRTCSHSPKTAAAMSAIEAAKEQAARSAVRNHVRDGGVVGVGSGSTIVYAVKMLRELQDSGSPTKQDNSVSENTGFISGFSQFFSLWALCKQGW